MAAELLRTELGRLRRLVRNAFSLAGDSPHETLEPVSTGEADAGLNIADRPRSGRRHVPPIRIWCLNPDNGKNAVAYLKNKNRERWWVRNSRLP
jgi:hypothetical protein